MTSAALVMTALFALSDGNAVDANARPKGQLDPNTPAGKVADILSEELFFNIQNFAYDYNKVGPQHPATGHERIKAEGYKGQIRAALKGLTVEVPCTVEVLPTVNNPNKKQIVATANDGKSVPGFVVYFRAATFIDATDKASQDRVAQSTFTMKVNLDTAKVYFPIIDKYPPNYPFVCFYIEQTVDMKDVKPKK